MADYETLMKILEEKYSKNDQYRSTRNQRNFGKTVKREIGNEIARQLREERDKIRQEGRVTRNYQQTIINNGSNFKRTSNHNPKLSKFHSHEMNKQSFSFKELIDGGKKFADEISKIFTLIGEGLVKGYNWFMNWLNT